MLTKNKFSFPLILFFSIYLFFCLNWNFVESKNLESRKPEISKIKKILTKRGRKFNFNKTDKLTSRKLNGEFFVDFALVGYYEDIEFSGYEILYYLDFCYDEEKYFKNYCNLDQMSTPINAMFDPQSLDKIVIFVDQLVDSKGETLINVGNNTEFYRDYLDLAIKGSSKNIQKIAKAVDALIDDKKYFYYLNGKCRDIKSEGNSIGLKLKNSNTTLSVPRKNIAEDGVSK
ncbi:unnamed protein product [Meloidogyne enterolobii]|uniref:Uncharacterized protein n=1 Tax=Meloidogyne enterolobii TaxID=390850 RepID=A0ACB0YMQ1_MELEN